MERHDFFLNNHRSLVNLLMLYFLDLGSLNSQEEALDAKTHKAVGHLRVPEFPDDMASKLICSYFLTKCLCVYLSVGLYICVPCLWGPEEHCTSWNRSYRWL